MLEIESEIDKIVDKIERHRDLEKVIPTLSKMGTESASVVEMEREKARLTNELPCLNQRWAELRREYHTLEQELDGLDRKR